VRTGGERELCEETDRNRERVVEREIERERELWRERVVERER
jgi:hypothetical protein